MTERRLLQETSFVSRSQASLRSRYSERDLHREYSVEDKGLHDLVCSSFCFVCMCLINLSVVLLLAMHRF